ncbi:MAG: glutamate synthase subunit alpha, partial [Acidimicrobiaceae bacterium]|nr:glutamate synthase subunit alpha [Acidimicrobiaceae bacterium]
MPPAQGLYHPRNEHDACGLNFVCDMHGRKSHEIVAKAIGALCNLEHRGARGADINTGDGAGILIQVPDRFFRDVVAFDLPEIGAYATGMAFLPQDPTVANAAAREVERILEAEGLHVLGWREVPIDESILGTASLMTMPIFRQVFVSAHNGATGIDLDRLAFIARKRIEREITVDAGPGAANEAMGGVSETHQGVYMPSLSARTFVYKGMLTTPQVAAFYPDLVDERIESAMALVHSRFSTNTFPSWPLAHPYRIVAHNGEINTIQGNRNWMRAREALLDSPHLPGLERAFPICTPGASDTAGFDEALELLSLGGYSLAEAVLMMIPEPWEHHDEMDAERKAFYQYNATRMEPWDGPASIAFTDGTVMGAVLDRNGLRPSRYWVTKDGLVVMASEVGVVDLPQDTIVEKGRLQPGRMFLIDTREGRIIRDHEVKAGITSARPYADWLESELVTIADLPEGVERSRGESSVAQLQQEFGYTIEEKKLLIAPMARDGKEAIGSMGTDTPIAVLSDRSRHVSDYFQQLFAQVTNPPLDAIREEIITSLFARVGPEGNLFDPVAASCRTIHLDNPVITDAELRRIVALDGNDGPTGFRTSVLDARFDASHGADGLASAIEQLRVDADAAIADGATVLVISDRGSGLVDSPIPSLLACSALHHHLVRNKTRTQVGVVVEAGDVREVHHIGTLLGYGANAINPYLAFATIDEMIADGEFGLGDLDTTKAHANYIKAAGLGILKIMSKMGISTVASYTGAQIFEAIGLSSEV